MSADWNENRIDEIINFNPTQKITRCEITPFVEMAALDEGQRDIVNVSMKEYKGSGSKFVNGDTLFSRITPCLQNGKTAKVSGLNGEAGFGSTEFITMSPKMESDQDFVYYLARDPKFRRYAETKMEGTSGRQRVSWQSLAEYTMRIPTKSERRKIGYFLCALDDKIATNRSQAITLESITRTIYKSWFVNFDPVKAKMEGREPEGMEADIAALFPDKLVESELGLIPEGWEPTSLSDMAEFLNGLALQKYPPTGDGDLPVLKIAQLRARTLDSEKLASKDIPEKHVVSEGDLIFSWSGSLIVDVWAGPVCALNQHLFKVTPKEWATKGLLWASINEHIDNFRAIAAAKAVTMGHIKRSHLKEAMVILPPKEEVQKITAILDLLINRATSLKVESQTLAELRDTLLPQLISGKLRIPISEEANS